MRWILKPIMRPIAKRNLTRLYAERDRIEAAIARARKGKARVVDLYELARETTKECNRWERWI